MRLLEKYYCFVIPCLSVSQSLYNEIFCNLSQFDLLVNLVKSKYEN